MKFFKKMKDGGPESTSTGYWLVEIKSLFSIVLLRFDGRSREAFHTHAFNCISWVLRGGLRETMFNGMSSTKILYHLPSFIPFITRRTDFHKVDSYNEYRNDENLVSWVLSFRGPWSDHWKEHLPLTNENIGLTHGRVVTSREVSQQ